MLEHTTTIRNRILCLILNSLTYICYCLCIKQIKMPSNNCCVIGCDSTYLDKVTRRHRFPKDVIRFNIWVQRSGNNNLLNKTVDQVYKSYIMCDKHFEPCHKSFGLKRLNLNALPTLHLPGKTNFFSFYSPFNILIQHEIFCFIIEI